MLPTGLPEVLRTCVLHFASLPFPAATITQASSSGLLLWDQDSLLSAVKVAVCPRLSWAPSRRLLLAALQARGITLPCYDAIPVSKQGGVLPVQKFWAALCTAGGPYQVRHHTWCGAKGRADCCAFVECFIYVISISHVWLPSSLSLLYICVLSLLSRFLLLYYTRVYQEEC